MSRLPIGKPAPEHVVLAGRGIVDPVVRLAQRDGRSQEHAGASEAQADLLRRVEAPARGPDVAIEIHELGVGVERQEPPAPAAAEHDLRDPLVGVARWSVSSGSIVW